MIRFKIILQWIWDCHIIPMTPSDRFRYMESKYGQKWYDYVDRTYEEKFGV
jgi:hypothetical protein